MMPVSFCPGMRSHYDAIKDNKSDVYQDDSLMVPYCKTQLVRKMRQFTLLLLLAVLVPSSCSDGAPEEEKALPVKTDRIEAHEATLTKRFPARIKATTEARLSFRVPGPVSDVLVEEGDYVEEGQLLARLDDRDYQLQLEATEARYEQVKNEAERITALYEKERVPVNDYEKAVSGLQQIEAKYEAHKNELRDTRLTAPFSGQVSGIHFDDNELVEAGMPVMTLVNPNKQELVAHLSAKDYLRKNHFVDVRFLSSHYPDRVFRAELREVAGQANLNGLYPAYFSIGDRHDAVLVPGMPAEIMITHTEEADTALFVVPSEAIFEKENQAAIWMLDEESSRVNSRAIEVVRITKEGHALVRGNLTAGERIVAAGVHALHENHLVSPAEEPADTNVGNLL